MNISLPETMRTFVENEVSDGGYVSASEYFRELVRSEQRRRAQERFENLILDGIQSGPGMEATPTFWKNLEAELFPLNEG